METILVNNDLQELLALEAAFRAIEVMDEINLEYGNN